MPKRLSKHVANFNSLNLDVSKKKIIINDRFQKKCFYESCIKSQMIKIINVYSQVPRTFDIAKAEKGEGESEEISSAVFRQNLWGGEILTF